MTVQDTNAQIGYIMLPRRLGLGILWTLAIALVAGGIAYATAQGRIAALEKMAEADGPKLQLINERTVRMENDIVWIRAALGGAGTRR